jgi:hypothetical protein
MLVGEFEKDSVSSSTFDSQNNPESIAKDSQDFFFFFKPKI